MSALTKEWSEYDHNYEKELQDIRLKNGKEVFGCWPNAGEWHCTSEPSIVIEDSEVTHTRLSLNF